ncbi:hypothetical protein M434DRAFT_362300 [Hypoxylon sp. CO27-5]|nr:hypothetical protein M434DRAFT_362300 [Hypoxylon sp. CO27-5]
MMTTNDGEDSTKVKGQFASTLERAAEMSAPRQTTSNQDTSGKPTKRRGFQMPIQLYENDEFADVQLTCGGRLWKLHKIVLCKRSSWFKKALTGRFVEASGKIDIQQWSPDLIDRLITYIYEGECIVSGKDDFVGPIELWQLGDYFLVSGMCDSALQHLQKNLKHTASLLQCIFNTANKTKEQVTTPTDPAPEKGGGAATASNIPTQTSATPLFSNQGVLTDIFSKFRAGLSHVYAKTTICDPTSSTTPVISMMVFQEGHPVRTELAKFYMKAGFQYYADPQWEFGSYIDKEVPRFASDVLRNLLSDGNNLGLLGIPETCSSCQTLLDTRSHNITYRHLLNSQKLQVTNDRHRIVGYSPSLILVKSGWITGFEAFCPTCARKWSAANP